MSRALSESLGWLKRQALSYLLILAILLAGTWLWNEYRRAATLGAAVEQAQAAVQQRSAAARLAQDGATLAERALAAELALLRKARDVAQREFQAKELERDAHRMQHWPWAGLHGGEALARGRLLEEQVAALRLAVRVAQERLDAATALQGAASGLRRLQEQARASRAEADRLRAQWHRLSAAEPVAQRFPWTAAAGELDRLKEQVERLQLEAVHAERAIAAAARSPELAEWLQRRAALQAAEQDLREAESAHAALAQALESNPFRQLRSALDAFFADQGRVFLLAFAILAGALLSRLFVKLLLYFVVAPFAGRRPPVRLLGPWEQLAFARALGAPGPGRISTESLALHLDEAEELLVRPECLQSSSARAGKRTAWLLNPALPFTSVLAGMYLLTRVHAPASEQLVLSAAGDPLGEIGLIELPPGAALALHPRCLAGVVQPRGQRVRVTRHWRLGSLHAWLTFQLRFLVFHGPCKLILQGRRGLRMERAGGGRMIRQDATLAFDASVPYCNVRTETFVPYWLGKEGLFNDRFGGVDGSYVYEERPLDRRGNALVGRGLEGLTDGMLRLFGI